MTNQLGFTARLLYVVALVLPTVLIADTMTTRAASAEVSSPDTYGSTQRNFKNSAAGVTSLTVRGWIDDVCLQFDLECLTQKSDNKGETTAQSKVIRELSWELNHRFSPNLNANGGVQADPVQWEVVLPTATSTKRVDVVVEDRSIEESFGIMEVKIWSNRVQVQPQIEEYIGVATNNGITAKADARLNLPDPRHGRDMACVPARGRAGPLGGGRPSVRGR